MRRVVVTGLGIVSPIGNTAAEVAASLRAGRSGIEAVPEMAEHGFRSRVAGTLKIDVTEHIDKRTLRFMGPGAAYAYIAMAQAIADAGLSEDDGVAPAHRADRRLWRPVNQRDVCRASDGAEDRGHQAHRSICRSQMHEFHDLGQSFHRLQDQGDQLFDHLCLLHERCIASALLPSKSSLANRM